MYVIRGSLLDGRWWYAIQWPEPGETEPAPPDYEILAGYPGVFVCVKGEQIGHVLDRRNPATCPNFTNLSRKPAEELQELLVKVSQGSVGRGEMGAVCPLMSVCCGVRARVHRTTGSRGAEETAAGA
jgi:hypothetical protein